MKRLALACAALLCALLGAHVVPRTALAAGNFTLSSPVCGTNLGSVTAIYSGGIQAPLGNTTVEITDTNGTTSVIPLNSVINPTGFSYNVNPGASYNLQFGPGALQNPNPAVTTPIALAPSTIVASSASLLTPGAEISIIDQNGVQSNIVDCPLSALSRILYVATLGFDLIPGTATSNSVCGPDLNGNPPTLANPGPCLTIQNALLYARDGDTINVEAGIYEICNTITVNRLVTITNPSFTTSKTILHSFNGGTVFNITAVGSPGSGTGVVTPIGPTNATGPTGQSIHAAINGLAIGGVTLPGSAAIELNGDAYTDVTNNVLGGDTLTNPSYTGIPCSQPQPPPGTEPVTTAKPESFANAESIILATSDHPNISNNDIIGSTQFGFTPVLAPSATSAGYGIVTDECLGQGSDISDAVNISNNLISKNTNAGIWLCSDGGGLHNIKNNVVRSNGRGIVMRANADATIDSNTVSDDFQDAIAIYDASSNDTVSNNLIESNQTPGAAGIRFGGYGAGLYPLAGAITGNHLLRNSAAIVIDGARNTQATGNTITAESGRTGILLQVGSTGAPSISQPDGTVLHTNTIFANGQCNAVSGCAIRLDAGVTTSVDANPNIFGLPASADPNTVLWHQPNDPSLGYISAGQVQPQPTVAISGLGSGPAPAVGPSSNSPPISTTPTPASNAGPPGSTAATPTAVATCMPTPTSPGCPAPTTTTTSSTTSTTNLIVASSFTSGALSSGPPAGSTTYSPVCSFVTVAANLVSTLSVAQYLSGFQPAGNISSAWRINNGTHLFESLYFADPNAPVQAITLRRGDIVSICVTATVHGPP